MADLPKNVQAWVPQDAEQPLVVALFLVPGRKLARGPQTWEAYRLLLAERVRWMSEQSPEDRAAAVDHLSRAMNSPVLSLDEALELLKAGFLDQRLSLLGANPRKGGRLSSPQWLQEVGLLEWASSLLEQDDLPPDVPPLPRRNSSGPTRRPQTARP